MFPAERLRQENMNRRLACATISSFVALPMLIRCSTNAQEAKHSPPPGKPSSSRDYSGQGTCAPLHPATQRIIDQLKKRAPGLKDSDYLWLAENYVNTAVNVACQHGKEGLLVLRYLGLKGLEVMRKYPQTFKELVPHLGGPAAARMLVFTREYFEQLAKQGGLPKFLEQLQKLPPKLQEMASEYPQWAPYLVVGKEVVYQALRKHPELCGLCFPLIDLSQGPEGIRRVAGMIVRLGDKCMPWVHARGLDGLLLADTFEPLLGKEVGDLRTFLGILHANQHDLAPLLDKNNAEREESVRKIRDAIRKIYEADKGLPLRRPDSGPRACQGDLVRLACMDGHTVLFVMEHPEALTLIKSTWKSFSDSGISLPSLLYDGYEDPRLPNLRKNALDALIKYEQQREDIYHTLVLMADFPQGELEFKHPRADRFRELLNKLDYRVVAYLGEAELLPESSRENKYRILEDRKKDALDEWEAPPSFWKETLPFYDTCRLIWVLSQGYTPTWGEVGFAALDVGFTIWDLASAGLGKAVTSAAKQGLKKVTGKVAENAVRSTTRSSVRTATKKAIRDISRKKILQLEQRMYGTVIGKLASSPKVLKKLWKDQAFTQIKSLQIPRLFAEKTARRMKIPLVKHSSKVLKFVFNEWKWNVAIGGGVKGLTGLAEKVPSDSPAAQLCAEKVQEVLAALESPIR